jgi:hypothetical protein
MHEWLEALQKSAKSTSPGVSAEELQRAETEAGVPLPGELGDLYAAFNGGTFEGDVGLYPLHGEGEQPSVLEKTRKALVGLPVSGVWRFGVKGVHRHLFTARKSAMVEQGDGGGPLPDWVQALGGEDWIYGTWDEEKREMRFYRSLSNMLNVLVPPVEREEFGDRTFARAIAAVQGALSELAEGEEAAPGEVQELAYEYEEGVRPKAGRAAAAEAEPKLDKPAVIAAERRVKNLKTKAARKTPPPAKIPEAGLEQAAVIAAERRLESLKSQERPAQPSAPRTKAVSRTAAKKAAAKKAPPKKAAAAKKAPAKKTPAKKKAAVAKKAPAKKAPAKKKAPAAKKAPAKKAAAKKAPAKKTGARGKR